MRRKGRNFISTTSAPTQALCFQILAKNGFVSEQEKRNVVYTFAFQHETLVSSAHMQLCKFSCLPSVVHELRGTQNPSVSSSYGAFSRHLLNTISRGALVIEMFHLSLKRFSRKTRRKAQVTVSSRIIANSNTAPTSPALSCEVFNATLQTKRTNFRLAFIVRLECRSFPVKPHLNEHQPQIFLKGSFELASFSSPLWLETIHLEVLPRQCIGIVGMRHEGDDAKERSLSRH